MLTSFTLEPFFFVALLHQDDEPYAPVTSVVIDFKPSKGSASTSTLPRIQVNIIVQVTSFYLPSYGRLEVHNKQQILLTLHQKMRGTITRMSVSYTLSHSILAMTCGIYYLCQSVRQYRPYTHYSKEMISELFHVGLY